MRIVRGIGVALAVLLGVAVVYAWAVLSGALGRHEPPGEPTAGGIPAAVRAERAARQRAAARVRGVESPRRILFGDLHVHTTYSLDAFQQSLPLLYGEGAHPVADACDFARYCSALDFWSINDHAESLTPRHWRDIREGIRQCNARAGDPADPDVVAYLGWEWTQAGRTPAEHWGHRNVVLRDLEPERVPARPVAAYGDVWEAMRRPPRGLLLAVPLLDPAHRQRYFDLAHHLQAVSATPVCAAGVDVRDLPPDCMEAAADPAGLFEKLAQWGHEALVIPHGTGWGLYTPPGASWDKQIRGLQHDPERQTLIEVYSGHGSSEAYRDWRAAERGPEGGWVCPEPSPDYTPACWRAGEIVRERCLEAGIADAECARRAAQTRRRHLAHGAGGHRVVPGTTAADWGDAGQCRDCFLPAYALRPRSSVQYALTLREPETARRFRFGFVASSDTHWARPGTGYKEVARKKTTDAVGARTELVRRALRETGGEPVPRSRDPEPTPLSLMGDAERTASFFYTGGLVAAHAAGRDREAIWQALERGEVYATSGPRILLWLDLRNAPGPPGERERPMGSRVRMGEAPRFRVRAVGAFRQRPGCPDWAREALGPERLRRLCVGECHHPAAERHPIDRIEVVRIRPRRSPDEPAGALVEDPWRVLPCPGRGAGCTAEFSDPEFPEAGRDAVYYVRALQAPTPAVNGATLRCERDASGRCVALDPCLADHRQDPDDDCLAPVAERAWSSPIYVDHRAPAGARLRARGDGG